MSVTLQQTYAVCPSKDLALTPCGLGSCNASNTLQAKILQHSDTLPAEILQHCRSLLTAVVAVCITNAKSITNMCNTDFHERKKYFFTLFFFVMNLKEINRKKTKERF
jgi:hypothetical protein